MVDDDAGTLAYAKDEKKRGADSVTLALVEIARVHELAGEVAPRKWSRHHDADGAPFEVVWAGGRLVLRAEDREERTMWVRGLQRRIAERRGRATGHPAEALASPRGADGEKTNTDESTASDDGSTTTSASHANAPAATTPTRLKARHEEDDDAAAAAHQHDEPRMSPVTEVVAAQQSPDARLDREWKETQRYLRNISEYPFILDQKTPKPSPTKKPLPPIKHSAGRRWRQWLLNRSIASTGPPMPRPPCVCLANPKTR